MGITFSKGAEAAIQASKVSSTFEQLSKTANLLNAASDRLNKAIETLDAALRKLNLGISSWVRVSLAEHDPFFESEELGYGKINGKWGVGLRRTVGNQHEPE